MSSKPFATIPAIDVKRLLPFMDFSVASPWCGVLRVEPSSSGCVLVATQGHFLATMPSMAQCSLPFSLQMSRRFANAIEQECRGNTEIVIDSMDEPAKIVRSDALVYIHPGPAICQSDYPQWRKVIPNDDELVPGIVDAFNPKYLHRAIRFVRWEGVHQDENSLRFFHKPGGPTVLRKRSMSVTIMPMKGQDFSGAGEWLK